MAVGLGPSFMTVKRRAGACGLAQRRSMRAQPPARPYLCLHSTSQGGARRPYIDHPCKERTRTGQRREAEVQARKSSIDWPQKLASGAHARHGGNTHVPAKLGASETYNRKDEFYIIIHHSTLVIAFLHVCHRRDDAINSVMNSRGYHFTRPLHPACTPAPFSARNGCDNSPSQWSMEDNSEAHR